MKSPVGVASCECSRSFRSRKTPQRAVEGSKRQVTGLASDFQDEAIGETECWPGTELLQGGRNDIGVLQREMRVFQQHLDCLGNLFRREVKDGVEHPQGLDQDYLRHPRAWGYESLRCRKLFRVVPSNESDQDVGINGAHGVCA